MTAKGSPPSSRTSDPVVDDPPVKLVTFSSVVPTCSWLVHETRSRVIMSQLQHK